MPTEHSHKQPLTGDPVEQLAQALAATERLVAGVRDEQWDNPTPCTDWTVRDLVGHLVGGNWLFARVLAGQESTDAGPDVLRSYQQSSQALLAAFWQPGALERTVTVPAGTVPVIAALHLRIVEALVHGWDLARATGQPAAFPDELAEQELAFSRSMMPKVPPDRSPFAPPQPVPDDAPAIDRLAAFLGRSVPAG